MSQWKPWSAGRRLGTVDLVADGSDKSRSPSDPEGRTTSGARVMYDTLVGRVRV
jgi:hypothetical protein